MENSSFANDPQFTTLAAPGTYATQTDAPVRYAAVTRNGTLMGYLYASVANDAAGFLGRADAGSDGDNVHVAWVRRLREAHAQGLAPTEMLAHWIGEPQDADAGLLDSVTTETTLADLRALAS